MDPSARFLQLAEGPAYQGYSHQLPIPCGTPFMDPAVGHSPMHSPMHSPLHFARSGCPPPPMNSWDGSRCKPGSQHSAGVPPERLARRCIHWKDCQAFCNPKHHYQACCRGCSDSRGIGECHDSDCKQMQESYRWGFLDGNLEKVLKLCRRASRIHFELTLIPTLVVKQRIYTSTEEFYNSKDNLCRKRFCAILILIVVAILPVIYAHFFMDQCGTPKAKKGKSQKECAVKGVLLENELLLGLSFVAGPVFATVIYAMVTALLQACAQPSPPRPPGALAPMAPDPHGRPFAHDLAGLVYQPPWTTVDSLLNLKRWMWRPLLLFWYLHVSRKVDRVKFANEHNLLPFALYSPPSVLVSTIYVVIIFQMLWLGHLSGNIVAGGACAFGILKVFAPVCNRCFGTDDLVRNFTEDTLREWRPPRHLKLSGHTVVQKLSRAAKTRVLTISLTHDDLLQLHGLGIRGVRHEAEASEEEDSNEDDLCGLEIGQTSDRMVQEGSVDDVGIFTSIFLQDTNIMVNLVTGKMDMDKGFHAELEDSWEATLAGMNSNEVLKGISYLAS